MLPNWQTGLLIELPIGPGKARNMVEELVIVGAGGFSRQIVELVEDLTRERPCWGLAGFLDDDPALAGSLVLGYPVLGPITMAGALDAASMVIGVANVRRADARRAIASRLALPANRYASLVHSSASVSGRAGIGLGTVVMQNVVISHGANLARHVLVSPGCVISHDARLDDGVTLASGVLVGGGCLLGAGAFLGTGCAIRDGVTIGEGAVVGMGAVVVKDVPPGVTVFGCPARERNGAARGV
jgi:sugar O-acyltransferase (sialic acid O-acetyltransferase NeuD family)